MRHWKWLPSEVVDATSLEAVKARMHGAVSSLVWWEASLPIVGGLELERSLQLKPFYDTMTLWWIWPWTS